MTVAKVLAAAAGLFLVTPLMTTAQVQQDRDRTGRLESDFAPPIDVWLEQDAYDRGAQMRPYFSTEPGAYVVVLRVTSDGELRIMYPVRPKEQKPYVLGQFTNSLLPNSGDPSRYLYESSGNGFVFAIASYKRFDFSYFSQGNTWSTARLASFGRYSDPFQVVRAFVDKILPESADYSLDYEVYEVYSRGMRSVYGSSVYGGRYGYTSLTDYHDACITAFGLRHSYYCQSYRGGYYGPVIVANPGRPNPNPNPRPGGKKMKGPRPLVHDPIVTTPPPRPEPAEGRQADSNPADRAAREYYERKRREVDSTPRRSEPIVTVPQARPESQNREPVIYRSAPRAERPQSQPMNQGRSEPRPESRPQASQPIRSEPRPVTPARVEVRNEPRVERPREVQREAPRTERPQSKENGKT